MIRWQPGYVYPPVFYPPHLPLDLANAVFFALLAVAVGVVAYRRPAYGVAALLACAPFADARYAFGTSLTVPKVALVGFVVALLVRRISWRSVTERPARTVGFAFAGMLAAIALSFVHAAHHDAVAREFAKWLEYALTFAAVVAGFASDPDDRPIWTALIALGLFEAAEAVFQLLFGAASGVFVRGQNVPRVAGSLEGPNQFAGWLDLLVPVLFARCLVKRDVPLLIALVVAAAAEAATLSRSGIVAAFVGIVAVVVVARPSQRVGRRLAAAVACVVIAFVVLGVLAGVQSRFLHVGEVAQADHLGTRGILWSSAIQLWRTSPLVGIGAGNFELSLAATGHPDVQTHANSVYLQALSETGLVGLGALLALIAASVATLARGAARHALVAGTFAGGVALAVHQVADDLWFYPKVGVFWAILLACAVVLAARGAAVRSSYT